MKFLVYIVVYVSLWLLAHLPSRLLSFFSDILYFFTYYVIGYRKKVVFGNMEKALPEYTEKEIKRIAKKFYSHFIDLMLESAIMHFISYERATKLFKFTNPELLVDLYNKEKPVVAVGGHYANWEFLNHLEHYCDYTFIAIYKPLNNKYFDRLVQQKRAKFGSIVVPMSQVVRKLMDMKREGKLAFTGFLSDQRPVINTIQYWTKFMGIDTPIYLGPEKIAKKLDAAVIFINTRRVRRGYYETHLEIITENAKQEEPNMITETHVRMLERLIREEPAYWLWSHNRWKFSFEDFKEKHPNYKSQ